MKFPHRRQFLHLAAAFAALPAGSANAASVETHAMARSKDAPARCASRITGIKIGSQSDRPHRGYRGKPSSRNSTQWQDVAAN
jgi:hypothetical protein